MAKKLIVPKPKKVDWTKLLFRASSFGMMTSGIKGISEGQLATITELEEKKDLVKGLGKGDTEKLEKLLSKEDPNEKQRSQIAELEIKKVAKNGLTDKQSVFLAELRILRDKPLELSKGAKSYIEKMYREVKWNRRVPLESKFLDKGNFNEDAAITMIALAKGEWLENNKARVNSKFFTGEVDMIEGYDAKCSWWLDSFPKKDDPLPAIYEFQNRVYMHLHDAPQWSTIYCLLDIPLHMMTEMIHRESFKAEFADSITIPSWRKMELFNLYVYTEKTLFEFVKHFDIDFKDDPKATDIMLNFVAMPEKDRMIEKIVYRDMDIENTMIEIVKLGRKELIRLDEL
jgi:hypothetical protein